MAIIGSSGVDPLRWYDADKPGELHDDLRRDYATTSANARKRSKLARHMDACSICLSIGRARASVRPPTTRKRIKLAIDHDQLRLLLRLPASMEIVHCYADPDPNVIYVLLAGDEVAETGVDQPPPVAPGTTHTTS